MWSLPGERTKNGRAHDVPLSDLALSIIERSPTVTDIDLVFTTTGTTPVSGFGRAKRQIDDAIATSRANADDDGSTMPPWRFHDLRRTMTTGIARLGTPPHVADRVLNHVSGTIGGVAAVYNRFQYIDERRIALDAWARHVERIVRGQDDGDVVVPMVRRET